MEKYVYFIGFVGLSSVGVCTYGNCVLTFSKPISSLKDVQATEAYIKTAPNKPFPLKAVCIISLQLLGGTLTSTNIMSN
jgi:hypothetical protein